jgi:hypothetical protein
MCHGNKHVSSVEKPIYWGMAMSLIPHNGVSCKNTYFNLDLTRRLIHPIFRQLKFTQAPSITTWALQRVVQLISNSLRLRPIECVSLQLAFVATLWLLVRIQILNQSLRKQVLQPDPLQLSSVLVSSLVEPLCFRLAVVVGLGGKNKNIKHFLKTRAPV